MFSFELKKKTKTNFHKRLCKSVCKMWKALQLWLTCQIFAGISVLPTYIFFFSKCQQWAVYDNLLQHTKIEKDWQLFLYHAPMFEGGVFQMHCTVLYIVVCSQCSWKSINKTWIKRERIWLPCSEAATTLVHRTGQMPCVGKTTKSHSPILVITSWSSKTVFTSTQMHIFYQRISKQKVQKIVRITQSWIVLSSVQHLLPAIFKEESSFRSNGIFPLWWESPTLNPVCSVCSTSPSTLFI